MVGIERIDGRRESEQPRRDRQRQLVDRPAGGGYDECRRESEQHGRGPDGRARPRRTLTLRDQPNPVKLQIIDKIAQTTCTSRAEPTAIRNLFEMITAFRIRR